ncbi:hypothetical protein FAVG1_10532 [Fusarium avenaceum]|nr:hypothetical protein FAVG1_10532 [Fusarium avenaceum]
MIFSNSRAILLTALAVVNAGPCRPSSSDSSSVIATTVTSDIISTAPATTLSTDSIRAETSTATGFAAITTLLQSDTNTLLATTSQEPIPTAKTTTSAMTISEAPKDPPAQCGDLPNPYTGDDGTEYELRCNWAYDGYTELDYLLGTTMEKYIEACGQRNDCNYVQFQMNNGYCILIGQGFDYTWNIPGMSLKRRPA